MKSNKDVSINKIIMGLNNLDKDKFYFVGAKLKCFSCKEKFGIEKEYMGVITCPYCGKYAEG